VGVADFPTEHGNFGIIAFTNNKDRKDHIAIVKGDIVHRENVLSRIHSSCVTGDVLGSAAQAAGEGLKSLADPTKIAKKVLTKAITKGKDLPGTDR